MDPRAKEASQYTEGGLVWELASWSWKISRLFLLLAILASSRVLLSLVPIREGESTVTPSSTLTGEHSQVAEMTLRG